MWFQKKYNECIQANIMGKTATIERLRNERDNTLENIKWEKGRYERIVIIVILLIHHQNIKNFFWIEQTFAAFDNFINLRNPFKISRSH